MSDAAEVAAVLHAPGMACVDLTPQIKQEMKPLAPGQRIEVHNDDPLSRSGIPAWCRLTGHDLEDVVELDRDRTTFTIRKKEN